MVASLTDDNEAGGNLDKRNIWLIGVGHTRGVKWIDTFSNRPKHSGEGTLFAESKSAYMREKGVCEEKKNGVSADGLEGSLKK
ncbi:hypothetical protein D3Z58_16120 [Clostridiaceae bacterium]|nr:hypothetical protein [Clostridiaceae bacterium]